MAHVRMQCIDGPNGSVIVDQDQYERWMQGLEEQFTIYDGSDNPYVDALLAVWKQPSEINDKQCLRIQRKRIKGWKMPANALCMLGPSRWGNPFERITADRPRERAVHLFRSYVYDNWNFQDEIRKHLRGKNLSCWCKPSQVCHADVLLESRQCVRCRRAIP